MVCWRNDALLKIKPVTWNNYIRHLKSIYQFGISQQLIKKQDNPFSQMFIKEGKIPKKTLSDNQIFKIENIIDYVDLPSSLQPSWFTRVLIKMFRYTGIRRGQLLKLTIQDIDLEHMMINIPAYINKNHDFHQIPISQALRQDLMILLDEHRKRKSAYNAQLFNINAFSTTSYNKGKEMTNDQLSYVFKHLSRLAGFTISPHRFRHTLATLLMRNPQNIYITQQLLGHKDLKVTLSYIEKDPEILRNILDNL